MTVLGTGQVLVILKAAGLELDLTPERNLAVMPASRLTPQLRDLLIGHKAVLVEWLSKRPANDEWNVFIPPGTSPQTVAKFWAASQTLDASQNYYDHHRSCRTCIAAGQGSPNGSRCDVGLSLWKVYQGTLIRPSDMSDDQVESDE